MLARRATTGWAGARIRRHGTAAVEFAFCMPLLLTIMAGLWEVGRIIEVQQVMWNSGREAARDASIGQDNLEAVANNLLTYLQAAEPTAFPPSHTTIMVSPASVGITVAANTTGWTCWDRTVGRELFTMTFIDNTKNSITDPTGMAQLDRFELSVQVPYSTVAWSPLAQITGRTRLSVAVDWVCMIDSPFSIAPFLPAQ
jgi:Flp pilus assembly protein TadG